MAPSLLTVAAALALTFALAPGMSLLSRLGLAFGIALVPASIVPLFGRSLKRYVRPSGPGCSAASTLRIGSSENARYAAVESNPPHVSNTITASAPCAICSLR